MDENLIRICLELGVGGIAAVLALAVWARTREAEWLLIVPGILAFYLRTITSVLSLVGFSFDMWMFGGISIFDIAVSVLPSLFFSIAFVIVLVKRSHI